MMEHSKNQEKLPFDEVIIGSGPHVKCPNCQHEWRLVEQARRFYLAVVAEKLMMNETVKVRTGYKSLLILEDVVSMLKRFGVEERKRENLEVEIEDGRKVNRLQVELARPGQAAEATA